MLCLSGFELYSRWVPLFKCNLRATKWLEQVIRDKRIIYYLTIIFEPCWRWTTRKSLAYNYLFYQEIFAFSETLSKLKFTNNDLVNTAFT